MADRYGALLARFDKPEALADESEEWLRQVLRGEDSPLKLPKGGAEAERLLRRDFRDKAATLRKKIDEFKANNPAAPPRAMVMQDAGAIQGQTRLPSRQSRQCRATRSSRTFSPACPARSRQTFRTAAAGSNWPRPSPARTTR